MNLSAIVYNLHSPYIFVDCDQQETFGQLIYSIETLRKYTDIPVVIFANSKYPLEEFRYIQKHFIKNMFSNIEIVQYKTEEVEQEHIVAYCVKETFDKFNYESILYLSPWSLFNANPVELFKEYGQENIYKAREPITECNALLIHKNKAEKFLNGFNIGYKTIPSDSIKINFNSASYFHSNNGCSVPVPMLTYNKKDTEFFIPSNYWNCSVTDRLKGSMNIICHNCCKMIKNPIVPDLVVL